MGKLKIDVIRAPARPQSSAALMGQPSRHITSPVNWLTNFLAHLIIRSIKDFVQNAQKLICNFLTANLHDYTILLLRMYNNL